MADDTKYFEVMAADEKGEETGRLSVTRMRNGKSSIVIEDWTEAMPPLESFVTEVEIILSAAEFRVFARWAKDVAG